MATSSSQIPRLSVIMPVHNAALYLGEAMRSILDQSYSDFELIVINDGSRDSSGEIIASFDDHRIRIIDHDVPRGVANSMNEAFDISRGEFVARMDADDISLPDRFLKQVSFLDSHPEIGVVFTRISQVDIYGNPAGTWEDDAVNTTAEDIRRCMPRRNCVANPTYMMRSSLVSSFRYDPNFRIAEDYAYWLNMLSRGIQMAKLNEVLLHYRIHPASLTQTDNRKNPHRKFLKFQWQYLRSFVFQNPWNSLHLKFARVFLGNVLLYPWRSWIRPMISVIKKLIRADVPGLIFRYLDLRKNLSQLGSNKLFFFFPFYHVGGAERVHADITQTVADHHPLLFFTKRSENKGFYDRFSVHAKCFDIWRLCWYPVFRDITAKLIARHINKQERPVVFGCNSAFFYSLIPHLGKHVLVIDLIHAFMHPEEDGAEKWALPHISRLDYRVVISKKTREELSEQYRSLELDHSLLDRIVFIRNFTPLFAESLGTLTVDNFRVVYLGRGSAEKRLDWIAGIARKVHERDPLVEFRLAGKDLAHTLSNEERRELIFEGEMTNDVQLVEWLSHASVLVLTSAREGFPMVVMEAMANGVIPICTAVGDIPNVIQHGVNGYLLDATDRESAVQEASDIILQLIHTPELFRKIRQSAYETAKSQFGSEAFVEAYRKLLLS